MPRIVIVHGTGAPPRSEESLRLEWLGSMQDALAFAGDFSTELDARFVNLDELGQAAAPGPDWEADTVTAWARTARMRRAEGADLTRLGRSGYFCGLPEDELLSAARTLRAFLHGEAEDAVEQVVTEIEAGADIVIGHAIGGIAAFDAVCLSPGVATLITIGTPLCAADALGRSGAGLGDCRWVNLVDRWDTLAYPAQGALAIDCEPRLRSPRNYLASPEFGRILAEALSA